jgi:RNA polymerase sigma-70 factor (ECF subfamily)
MAVTADNDRRLRFERLLSEDSYNAAWRYAWRLCGQRDSAEDLLQEALTAAFVSLEQLREESAFTSWLLSIVRTKFFRLRQRELRQASLPAELAPVGESGESGDDSVIHALGQLPGPQQEILSLFYIEGLSLAETGTVLGIPAKAVKQRLFRAREALRRRLDVRQRAGDFSALL